MLRKSYLQASRDKIFFVDENNAFVKTKEFAEIVNSSDNYFVLIYRDSLPQLPYSIEEIYGMCEGRVSQKYVGIKRVYNELYRLYNLEEVLSIHPNLVVTEDSNAGYECFEEIFPGKCVEARVNEQVPYHRIHENGDNLWSALLETGYLSKAVPENMVTLPLRLPNRSVEAAFRQEVWEYFQNKE